MVIVKTVQQFRHPGREVLAAGHLEITHGPRDLVLEFLAQAAGFQFNVPHPAQEHVFDPVTEQLVLKMKMAAVLFNDVLVRQVPQPLGHLTGPDIQQHRQVLKPVMPFGHSHDQVRDQAIAPSRGHPVHGQFKMAA